VQQLPEGQESSLSEKSDPVCLVGKNTWMEWMKRKFGRVSAAAFAGKDSRVQGRASCSVPSVADGRGL
jgi:hypothetical protein